jgi:hypothetical protein
MTSMDVGAFVAALTIPAACRVDQRVPKKLLTEHGAPTAADRRQIQDGVDEIVWIASLKPHLIGVQAFKDQSRDYQEIAVLSLTLKPGAQLRRLTELLHRAVPYPMLLLTTSDTGLSVSMAHLRASQNEADKLVIDGELLMVTPAEAPAAPAFLDALALSNQPQTDLGALYQGWLDLVDALDMAGEIGRFQPSGTRAEAVARHAAMHDSRSLRVKLVQLRERASTERQMARRVTLNQAIHDGEAELTRLQQVLGGATE